MEVTTHAARVLLQADGVSFVLRDGDLCYYAEEDAIGPLWKGRRFPMSTCISGWSMERGQAVTIPDITLDPRIPQDAYKATFVKSLAIAPVRMEETIAAVGAYWATLHSATPQELDRLQTIANTAALAIAHVQRGESQQALRTQAAMLDALLEHVPEGITIARAPDVTIERVSAHGLSRIRKSQEDVTGIAAEEHPRVWQVYDAAGQRLLSPDELPLTRAVKFGETIENEQLSLKLADESLLPILCNAGPIRGADGTVTGGIIAWRDITERTKADEARQLLVRELNHRVKNFFAVLTGIVSLTARNSATVEEMADAVIGRISALARAHELIRPALPSGGGSEESNLADFLAAVISPHLSPRSSQLRLTGAAVPVGPDATAKLALIIHELATNAGKYGALSKLDGCVEVDWQIEGTDLILSWVERNGPLLPKEPEQRGFGSRLIEATVKRQLGGRMIREWHPTGLRITFSVPLRSLKE